MRFQAGRDKGLVSKVWLAQSDGCGRNGGGFPARFAGGRLCRYVWRMRIYSLPVGSSREGVLTFMPSAGPSEEAFSLAEATCEVSSPAGP